MAFKVMTGGFGVTLALIVVWQLTPDARALVLGMMLGLAAGAPLGGMVVWFIMANHQALAEKREAPRDYARQPAPPVIIVQPPSQPPHPYPQGAYLPPINIWDECASGNDRLSPGGRRYTVIGDD